VLVDEIVDTKGKPLNAFPQSATRRGYLAETECSEDGALSLTYVIPLGDDS
jgi:hypothetical protein